MKQSNRIHLCSRTLGLAALLATVATAQAQTGYGVDASGALFSFNLSSPSSVTSIGNLGFTPEAIDFRPGTSTLYAVNIDSTTGNGAIYTVNTTNGTTTLIGTGFTSAALIGSTSIAFDFNPTTLQGDGTIRIRLVDNDGSNFRLHSGTGGIAATDSAINGVPGASISGAAYINSDTQTVGGSTALYYIDSAGDSLLLSTNPNGGVVEVEGSLGVDVGINLGFDIYSGAGSETGYIVNSTGTNMAALYTVDLTNGAATLVGGVSRDFTGGFAIDQLSAIPEPSSFAAIAGVGVLGLAATRRRRASK